MLSDAQRALLATRLRRGRAEVPTLGMPRRPSGIEELPLSFAQEQLWFIDQLAPGLPTYNVTGVVHLDGPLDAAALRRALDALVARHETLRTRLVSEDGRPHQVVDPPRPVPLPLEDLGGLDRGAAEVALRELTLEEANGPFSLDRGPLLRARLVRVDAEANALIVVAHHTVFDGWSFGVLVPELAALYEAEVAGAPPALEELAVQFADYALWEREQLQGGGLEALVDYWRQALDGAPVLEMPTDRPRPLIQTYDGGMEAIEMDAALLESLVALGRREGVTLFVTLLAAFLVLLQRYSGQDDVVAGTVSANRSRPELAPLIAFLVNTLAIRTDLSGDPTFLDLLSRVKAATLGAYAHQDLPFAKLVESLRVARDPGRSPIFQVGFLLGESSGAVIAAGGVTFRPEVVDIAVAKFDLNWAASEVNGRLRVAAAYATALYEGATVRRMLGHYRTLLEGIVADPSLPLSRLPLLSAAERHRELVEWNDNVSARPPRCLHEVFEELASAAPDAVAVELDGRRLTYGELDARANQVARRLRALGVAAESLVGVCMQRSLRRMVALMGILKAGGGYVPLDPDYPADRLAFMVRDAGVAVAVTDDESEGSLPAADVAVLSMDRDWPSLSALEASRLGAVARPAGAAYVIYTSGSTGRPKGVVVEHRNAVNFAFAEIDHFRIGPADRVLQFASLNFDVSVLDMFVPLLSGGTIVMGARETLLSPPRLADLIRRERVTLMCLPPAVLNLIAGEAFPALRVVIAGGEAFSSALVHSWARPGLRFVNGYGPTETTVGSTMLECADDGVDPPPIGLPLINYQAYVLDRRLEPVPVGVSGELHIGGASVSRGYLGQPGLTGERFVPDPYGGDPNGRLYKTGDVARRLPDGNLQFLGRFDDQVKIRGYRIELGEVEAVLAQHPAVAQTAVVVGRDRAGEKQLVAYARPDPPAGALDPADLRRHLAARLPAYMVPAHVVILDAFPLNRSGKVDRSALPAPDAGEGAAAFVPPRTIVEAFVVDMFAGLLNAERVGVDDNFFDLGGNSLQAMRVTALLRRELAVDTDVTSIFLAPTAAELAAVLRDQHGLADAELDEDGLERQLTQPVPVEEKAPSRAAGPLVYLAGAIGSPPLFVVHAVGGTVHAYAALAKELADAFTVYGLQAAGLQDATSPAASLDAMVASYLEAIRRVQPDGPYRLAGWSMGGIVASEMARRLEASGDEVALLALLDAPFTLAYGSVLSEEGLAALFASDAARALGRPMTDAPDATASVADQLRWLAAGSEDGELFERRYAVFRAHLLLIAGHEPSPVRARTVVVGAADSPNHAGRWLALTGDVHAVQVPGDHYSFLRPPAVEEVATAIRDANG